MCESHWGDVTMRPEITLFFPSAIPIGGKLR